MDVAFCCAVEVVRLRTEEEGTKKQNLKHSNILLIYSKKHNSLSCRVVTVWGEMGPDPTEVKLLTFTS